jgi:hypothetical protein
VVVWWVPVLRIMVKDSLPEGCLRQAVFTSARQSLHMAIGVRNRQ